MKTKRQKLEPELLVDSAHGIYIPQSFCQRYGIECNFKNWDDVKDIVKKLAHNKSIDDEFYYDDWDELMNKAILISHRIGDYYLSYLNDCDLWAVPMDYVHDEY